MHYRESLANTMDLFCCCIFSVFIMDLSVDTAGPSSMCTRSLVGIISEWNFQTFVWLLCTSPWEKCRKYLQRSLVTSYGIARQLVIYFILMSVLVPHTFAASLAENGCNEICNLSVDHFCKLFYNSRYHCMACKMVCANGNSKSDRDVCNENCQGSQYFPQPSSTNRPTTKALTPNRPTSILKPSTHWMKTSDEVTSSDVGSSFKDHTFSSTSQGEIVARSSSDFTYLCTVAILAVMSFAFLVWLWCNCASSRKRRKISSESKGIPMKVIKVQNNGTTACQTGRPPTEHDAVQPSGETQQEVPVSLCTNRAVTKGTAAPEMTQNSLFPPEDVDPSRSEMALSDDFSKVLPARVQEET